MEFTNPLKHLFIFLGKLFTYVALAAVVVFLSFGINPLFAQSKTPKPSYKLLAGQSFVQSKNYYLLTLFQEIPEVKKLLEKDSVLNTLAKIKAEGLISSLSACNREASCYADKMKFSDQEIKLVGERLSKLYKRENALGDLITQHLIPSGTYILFQNLSPQEMLVKAWEQDAMGVNFAIGVYAEGKKPNYPLIDSVSFDTRDGRNSGLLYNTASLVGLENKKNTVSFFAPSLTCALRFIEMNEREQAADFEPMTETENKAAYQRVKTIKWDAFKYSVIVVPGAGPDIPTVALSAEGMLRCRLAAIQYRKGMAPYILVSGGKVHPYKTKYCEATEMKKFLIDKLKIPENAIIIDPHARHTTTNMRNAARLIYRYGIPFNKPGISCTTRGQSNMIGVTLIDRCLKELHEAPYRNGLRLSETEIEFYPLLEALHINPTEPIDP